MKKWWWLSSLANPLDSKAASTAFRLRGKADLPDPGAEFLAQLLGTRRQAFGRLPGVGVPEEDQLFDQLVDDLLAGLGEDVDVQVVVVEHVELARFLVQRRFECQGRLDRELSVAPLDAVEGHR